MGKKEATDALVKIADASFRQRLIWEGQEPLRAIPAQVRRFLPKNIIVRVDDDGSIREITDRFLNERETLEEKSRRLKLLLSKRRYIEESIQNDLDSEDPETQILALISSIMLQTGIRPGTQVHVHDPAPPGRITYGAISLRPEHIEFDGDSAVLSFPGKKGTINRGIVNGPREIELLREFVQGAKSRRRDAPIFSNRDVPPIEYRDLKAYFDYRFEGINPTDFRKLRATQVAFDALREEAADLSRRVQDAVEDEGEDLQERVADAVADAIQRATERAQEELSHLSPDTTKESYIGPEVLLDFLSRGKAADTLEEAILNNQKFVVFDVDKFSAKPLAPNPADPRRLELAQLGIKVMVLSSL
jgi:integrase